MLLGRQAGHRLDPVAIVRRALGDGPVLHCVGNNGGDTGIEWLSVFNDGLHDLIGLLGNLGFHHCVVENHAAKDF
jgi:hypothetical protein